VKKKAPRSAPKARARAKSDLRKPVLGKRTVALQKVLEAKAGAVGRPMAAPTGSTPLVLIYKVMGKMFAILSLRADENVILKCDPHLAEMLRETYQGVGHRSHLDKRFWIAVNLNADVPPAEVKRLAGHSYDLVCAGLTKKQQAELAALR
jgi:predicted DNA-binding protein (MmcQ/YjbR family)